MKSVSVIGLLTGSAAAISKDDLIFILSLAVTIINAIIYYLEHRKNDKT